MGASSGALKAVSQIGADEADHLVSSALEAGIDYFYTADFYHNGQAEQMLGDILKGRRDRSLSR